MELRFGKTKRYQVDMSIKKVMKPFPSALFNLEWQIELSLATRMLIGWDQLAWLSTFLGLTSTTAVSLA